MLSFIDKNRLTCTAWAKIQIKAIEAKNAQNFYLKCFFPITL